MNLKHSSLISLFTNYLEDKNISYDIIYADKYGIEEKNNAKNIYKFELKFKDTTSKIQKVIKYIEFAKFAKNILKENDYKLIIVWRTETALLLFRYLYFSKSKFILNIRDYCFEKNVIIQSLIKKLVDKSTFTAISSKGFLRFLPRSNKYIFVNSYNKTILPNEIEKNMRASKPINISFIGYVRFIDQDINLINEFKNDERFTLSFIGAGSEKLRDFIKENKIKNVILEDGFPVDETMRYLRNADIINNLYGSGIISLDTAISTRYYHSVLLNKPILVSEGTYMSTLVDENQGYKVNIYNGLADKIYDWYLKIDFEKLYLDNQNKLKEIIKEDIEFIDELNKIFEDGGKYQTVI
ncbi:capsular biosynthesis protein [Macrococcus epidermidis]|uniref:Capsular biosynthesis protein n=1 Tax=Macrococcus epidermidis TaxID=1902580 RepID=A0A327ZP10_9STAP|nr:capsular biosynthesis protein [Macrococcus epidermidis]RAK44101.1 capsular biosynthesis protein [Macrococcus epidermidis]